MKTYNAAVVGFGYWGPNLARNINSNPNFILSGIADLNQSKRDLAKNQYPSIIIEECYTSFLNDDRIDVIVVATSSEKHYEIAKAALLKNKHVLLEKPACASYEKLSELHDLAKARNLILMIDYTFLYNGAVKKINEIIKSESFGEINYIDTVRINLGIFQNDVNVIWDLASHDIAIINSLTGQFPTRVKADGISHTDNEIENIAYITLKYNNPKLIVHISCSWYSPVKIRQMLIGGDKKMLIYNDIEPTDKIKVYDCGFNFKQSQNRENLLVDYRLGDITIPKFDTTEPLAMLIDDLYIAILKNKQPIASSMVALNVSKVLEAAQQSVKSNGVEISVLNN